MSAPRIRRLVASPDGEFALLSEHLSLPLEGCPNETPYADYFREMEAFLAADGYAALLAAASKKLGRNVALSDVSRIDLRSEKHGAYYHPASVDILTTQGGRARFCLLAATALLGFLAMEEEYETLAELNAAFPWKRLPEVYAQADRGDMSFMLAEWITDHHEFHVMENGRTILWDFDRGRTELAPEQAVSVYEQAAGIAALYYGFEDGRRIHPWHHAAGDFIVGILENGEVSVRLCTARGYEPILENDGEPDFTERALEAFFLDLTLRLLLDRIEGTEAMVFLGEEVLEAGLSGFFKAMESKGLSEAANALSGRLAAIPEAALCAALSERLSGFGATDRGVIEANLPRHARALSSLLTA